MAGRNAVVGQAHVHFQLGGAFLDDVLNLAERLGRFRAVQKVESSVAGNPIAAEKFDDEFFARGFFADAMARFALVGAGLTRSRSGAAAQAAAAAAPAQPLASKRCEHEE